ncbi:MAG: sigma-E factor negative regulatory protein [Massilia sp.]
MDAHKKIREHISALGDGELASSDLELAAAALRTPDGELAWITYHRIGDVLRAQAAPELSAGFNERLNEKLAAEAPPLRRSTGAATAATAATAAAAATASSPQPGGTVKVVTTP